MSNNARHVYGGNQRAPLSFQVHLEAQHGHSMTFSMGTEAPLCCLDTRRQPLTTLSSTMSDHEEEQAALQQGGGPELEQATLDDSASEVVAERLSKVDLGQPGKR